MGGEETQIYMRVRCGKSSASSLSGTAAAWLSQALGTASLEVSATAVHKTQELGTWSPRDKSKSGRSRGCYRIQHTRYRHAHGIVIRLYDTCTQVRTRVVESRDLIDTDLVITVEYRDRHSRLHTCAMHL